MSGVITIRGRDEWGITIREGDEWGITIREGDEWVYYYKRWN